MSSRRETNPHFIPQQIPDYDDDNQIRPASPQLTRQRRSQDPVGQGRTPHPYWQGHDPYPDDYRRGQRPLQQPGQYLEGQDPEGRGQRPPRVPDPYFDSQDPEGQGQRRPKTQRVPVVVPPAQQQIQQHPLDSPWVTPASRKPSQQQQHPDIRDHRLDGQYGVPWSGLPPQHEEPGRKTPRKKKSEEQQPLQPLHHRGIVVPPVARPSDHPSHQENGLKMPSPRRTKLVTWLLAICCAIFWILVILGGIIILIIYLIYRPHNPRFNVSSVTLNAAYLDAGSLLNADLTMLANFTNPNKKGTVDFNSMIIDLYYGTTLIASQYIPPFSVAKAESQFATIHMVTSQVRLPTGEIQLIQSQVNRNEVTFDVKGVFHVRTNLGSFLRYSYKLYGHCRVVVTSSPTGVLRASKCVTKR